MARASSSGRLTGKLMVNGQPPVVRVERSAGEPSAIRTLSPTNRDDRTEVALNRNRLLLWIVAGFLAFPLAGLAARAIGVVDGLAIAFAAGAIAGAVIGAAQWLVLRGVGVDARWIVATAGGFGSTGLG